MCGRLNAAAPREAVRAKGRAIELLTAMLCKQAEGSRNHARSTDRKHGVVLGPGKAVRARFGRTYFRARRQVNVCDASLKKACAETHIPVLGRVHWAKHRAGQTPARIRSPVRPTGMSEHVIPCWKTCQTAKSCNGPTSRLTITRSGPRRAG